MHENRVMHFINSWSNQSRLNSIALIHPIRLCVSQVQGKGLQQPSGRTLVSPRRPVAHRRHQR